MIIYIFIELLIGIYIADLLSGIIHLRLDYETVQNNKLRIHVEKNIPDIIHFKKTSDIFKNASRRDKFIWNFQSHHDVPYPRAESDIEELFKLDTWLSMIFPNLIPLIIIGLLTYNNIISYCILRISIFSIPFMLFSQQTHFLAHARNHNAFDNNTKFNKCLYWMQDHHIILNPNEHKKHHLKFNCNFCVVNGWANPLLNKITILLVKMNIISNVPNTILIRKEIEKK